MAPNTEHLKRQWAKKITLEKGFQEAQICVLKSTVPDGMNCIMQEQLFSVLILKIRDCKLPILESQLSTSPAEMSDRLGLNLMASVPGPVCQVLLCLMINLLFDENTV